MRRDFRSCSGVGEGNVKKRKKIIQTHHLAGRRPILNLQEKTTKNKNY